MPMSLDDPDLLELSEARYIQVMRELGPGERLRWMGRPNIVRYILLALPLALLGCLVSLFALYFLAGLSDFAWPDQKTLLQPAAIIALGFLASGALMIASPLWFALKAWRSFYLITNKRAIVFDGGLWINIRSFPPERLGALRRRSYLGGYGDIIFDEPAGSGQDLEGAFMYNGFYALPDVIAVEAMLNELAAGQGGEAGKKHKPAKPDSNNKPGHGRA